MEPLPANETKQGKTIKNLSKGVCSSRPTESAQKKKSYYENSENQTREKTQNMENIFILTKLQNPTSTAESSSLSHWQYWQLQMHTSEA